MGDRGSKEDAFKVGDIKMWLYRKDHLMIWEDQHVKCSLKPSCTVYLGQRVNNFLAVSYTEKMDQLGQPEVCIYTGTHGLAFSTNLKGEPRV